MSNIWCIWFARICIKIKLNAVNIKEKQININTYYTSTKFAIGKNSNIILKLCVFFKLDNFFFT